MAHYIAMSGSHGCLPDHCEVYPDWSSAFEDLVSLFELNGKRKKSLKDTGYLELVQPDDGAAYCQITACNCPDPQEHSEEPIDREWFGLEDEEEAE